MSDKALLELVSAASDGELDLRQQAEVERRLRDSAAARRFLTDLDHLGTLMSSLPEQAVPDTLHARIVAAAGAAIRKPATRRSLLFPVNVFRYGLAAVAGGLLTIAVYEWQPVVPADYQDLTGTMVPGDARDPSPVLARDATQLPELEGQVELQRQNGNLLLDVRLDAAESVDLRIDFTAAGLRPVGLLQHRTPFESIEISDRLLRARGVGGHHVSVSLRRAEDAAAADETAIRLEYSSNGRVLKQGSLSPAVEPNQGKNQERNQE